MRIKGAQVFQPDGRFVAQDLYIQEDRLTADAGGDLIDATGLYAIPGLVDLHFHGCMGYDFCDGTQQAISAIAVYQASMGVAAMCPATMTYPEDVLGQIADTAAAYRTEPNGAALVGINMEGPFLSLAKCGAQNPAFLHAPDAAMFRRLQSRADGLFRLLAIAPELEGAMDCIHALADEVRISLAHTTADYDTACAAFAAGAKQVTHLYNAMPPLAHRAPAVIGAAFDHAETVELIADGLHVHPSVVRTTFRLFGPARVCLISDSMMATGLSDGAYSLGGQAVTVRGNHATLADGTIAGSATCLLDCLRIAVRDMDIPLGDAVRAASSNPARALHIADDYGTLDTGKLANIILLNHDLQVQHIMLRGQILA